MVKVTCSHCGVENEIDSEIMLAKSGKWHLHVLKVVAISFFLVAFSLAFIGLLYLTPIWYIKTP